MNETQKLEFINLISPPIPWWGVYCVFGMAFVAGLIYWKFGDSFGRAAGIFIMSISAASIIIAPSMGYLP